MARTPVRHAEQEPEVTEEMIQKGVAELDWVRESFHDHLLVQAVYAAMWRVSPDRNRQTTEVVYGRYLKVGRQVYDPSK